MTRRKIIACVAALAAAVSIGALGYAVLWAFDFSELVRPVAQEPQREKMREETKPAAPRRRPLVIVAPRVPGEDTRGIVSPGVHAVPAGDMVAAVPMRQGDEPSPLVAVVPPPAPPAPGVDGPPIAASARVSAASPAINPPLRSDAEAVSALVPQTEAAAPVHPPVHSLAQPDPEPTGTIRPPAFTFQRPRPIQRPRDNAMAPPPGVTIIRGVPPVPAASPGIVRPGPLIIQVPQGPRR
jgi:hypothetical protein